jgi:hypothetical protein
LLRSEARQEAKQGRKLSKVGRGGRKGRKRRKGKAGQDTGTGRSKELGKKREASHKKSNINEIVIKLNLIELWEFIF